MRAQFINEKQFARGKNPKNALNIGIANSVFSSCGKPYEEGGGYSFVFYGEENWMDIIQWLLSQGYTPEETEQVMRSKLMRWASDKAGHANGDCTLEDFLNFNSTEPGYRHRGKTQVDDFLDEYFADPDRKNRLKHVYEDAMGGVSAPMATLNNTPGMGNAQPASATSAGSGDSWDASIGPIHIQESSKKVNEQNINPHDKLGVAMAKKMGIKLPFKKGKGDQDVEQLKVDEDIDLSSRIMSFEEWSKQFLRK